MWNFHSHKGQSLIVTNTTSCQMCLLEIMWSLPAVQTVMCHASHKSKEGPHDSKTISIPKQCDGEAAGASDVMWSSQLGLQYTADLSWALLYLAALCSVIVWLNSEAQCCSIGGDRWRSMRRPCWCLQVTCINSSSAARGSLSCDHIVKMLECTNNLIHACHDERLLCKHRKSTGVAVAGLQYRC